MAYFAIICISLIATEIKCILICLSVTYISPAKFTFEAHISINLQLFVICFENILSHFGSCVLILLLVPFVMSKFLIFMKSNISIFFSGSSPIDNQKLNVGVWQITVTHNSVVRTDHKALPNYRGTRKYNPSPTPEGEELEIFREQLEYLPRWSRSERDHQKQGENDRVIKEVLICLQVLGKKTVIK